MFSLDTTVQIRRNGAIGVIVGTDNRAAKYLVKLGNGAVRWFTGADLMEWMN